MDKLINVFVTLFIVTAVAQVASFKPAKAEVIAIAMGRSPAVLPASVRAYHD